MARQCARALPFAGENTHGPGGYRREPALNIPTSHSPDTSQTHLISVSVIFLNPTCKGFRERRKSLWGLWKTCGKLRGENRRDLSGNTIKNCITVIHGGIFVTYLFSCNVNNYSNVTIHLLRYFPYVENPTPNTFPPAFHRPVENLWKTHI